MNRSIKILETDRDELRRLRDNLKWISSNHDDLKNQFNYQYVAVKENMVVDRDTNHDYWSIDHIYEITLIQ
jgi:hypothetical protein